jgi:hypothetical protein
MELLGPVDPEAMHWDEAAVQLTRLRAHVRRVGYPQYLYGLLSAGRTASAIGAPRYTAIEFGVAGGNGLVAIEKHAEVVKQLWKVDVDVVGFDMGSGLPARTDPRDCPFAFQGGEFSMDEPKLRSRLRHAEIRLGDVAETVQDFTKEGFSPLGFISNDFDLYTSTRDSFVLFDIPKEQLLPRITMYCDDVVGYPYTTATGEWAAIEEFNARSDTRKIGQIYGLRHCLGSRYRFVKWPDMVFILSVFDHDSYNSPETTRMPDQGLNS